MPLLPAIFRPAFSNSELIVKCQADRSNIARIRNFVQEVATIKIGQIQVRGEMPVESPFRAYFGLGADKLCVSYWSDSWKAAYTVKSVVCRLSPEAVNALYCACVSGLTTFLRVAG